MARNTRYSVIPGTDITSEKLLSRIWQDQHLKPGLSTTDGQRLRVIFPGRLNGLGGPDFRRAILSTRHGQLRGDVELHLRSSLWRDHGHHRDPAYNSVVLHVVMWHDSPIPIYLHNGKQVPTLALAAYLLGNGRREGGDGRREPCRQPGRRLEPIALQKLLDRQGELRFMNRVQRFRERIGREDPSQVLYEGIMEALGYSRNQESFKELARRLPLSEAEAVTKHGGWRAIHSLLLEQAGLSLSHPTPHHSPPKWQLQGVRPVNQPARRLLAMSHLLERYASAGLVAGLMAAVKRAAGGGCQSHLESMLTVTALNEQGPITTHKRQPALLGKERAGEMAVNILLPFGCARALESEALELYRGYKPLPDNEITREMSELLGVDKKLVNSACRQQGLIHLFKLFCAERQCQMCPLGASSRFKTLSTKQILNPKH